MGTNIEKQKDRHTTFVGAASSQRRSSFPSSCLTQLSCGFSLSSLKNTRTHTRTKEEAQLALQRGILSLVYHNDYIIFASALTASFFINMQHTYIYIRGKHSSGTIHATTPATNPCTHAILH